MKTDNEPESRQTLAPAPPARRYLVLVPVGTCFRPAYDGDSESAALEAYRYTMAHNQLPLFCERRRVVVV